MASDDVARVVEAYRIAEAEVRRQVAQYVRTVYLGLPGYRDADGDTFVNRIVPVVLAAQRHTANLTTAYLAQVSLAVLGDRGRIRAIPPAEVDDVRGVDPYEVYRRPFTTVWWELSQGRPYDTAVRSGLTRATILAATGIQLAKTHASAFTLGRDRRVVGYLRLVTGRQTCRLCHEAATKPYHSADLMPIHPGCSCTVVPIYRRAGIGDALGVVAAAQALSGAKQAMAEPEKDANPTISVHHHGEMGPLLYERGQHFAGDPLNR